MNEIELRLAEYIARDCKNDGDFIVACNCGAYEIEICGECYIDTERDAHIDWLQVVTAVSIDITGVCFRYRGDMAGKVSLSIPEIDLQAVSDAAADMIHAVNKAQEEIDRAEDARVSEMAAYG